MIDDTEKNAIGPVPVIPPNGAIDDEDDNPPFVADPNDPNVQALAKAIGWDAVKALEAQDREARESDEREEYSSPLAEDGATDKDRDNDER